VRVDPGAPEAWTLILTPIWIIVAIAVFDHPRAVPVALVWLTVGALFLHNLFGGMLLMRASSTDFNAQKSAWLVANTRPDDVILTAAGSVFTRYLAYHSPALVIGMFDPNAVERDYRLALTTHGKVYITGDVFQPPPYIRDGQPPLYAALGQLAAQLRDNVSRVRSDVFGGVHVVTGPNASVNSDTSVDPRMLQGVDACT
jgi:hypothetical protein